MQWWRYVVNESTPTGELLDVVTDPLGIRTEIYGERQPGGWVITLSDEIEGRERLRCLDLRTLWRLLGSGYTIDQACRRIAPKGLEEQACLLARRARLYYGVLTPLLVWPALQDLVVVQTSSGVEVSVRAAGLGDAYHKVQLTPSECEERRRGGGEEDATLGEYLINQAAEQAGVLVTAYSPVGGGVDVRLNLRITAFAEPVAKYSVAFRKRPHEPWTLQRLAALGTIDPQAAAQLLCAFSGCLGRPPQPVLVYGQMGSGKTTLTEALVNSAPPWLSIVMIQDVAEYVPARTAVLLNSRQASGLGAREISKAELIAAAMRSGAQLVVVNEILRPEDARAWFLAVTSGHGGATTIHAGSYEELRLRIAAMGIDPAFVERHVIAVEMRSKRVAWIRWPSPPPDPPEPLVRAMRGEEDLERAWWAVAAAEPLAIREEV